MPKPYMEMAGSGAHIHVSVLDEGGRNIFASDDATGSEQLKHAIGGLAATMADAMLIFAPTANSYRRYRSEAYVPLNASWAVNNRGVALRIPSSSAVNRRVEHRVAGADANPYLLTAAVLAGIHHGLQRRLDPRPADAAATPIKMLSRRCHHVAGSGAEVRSKHGDAGIFGREIPSLVCDDAER